MGDRLQVAVLVALVVLAGVVAWAAIEIRELREQIAPTLETTNALSTAFQGLQRLGNP